MAFRFRLPPEFTVNTVTALLPLIVTLCPVPSIVKDFVTVGSVEPRVIVPLTLKVIVSPDVASVIASRKVQADAQLPLAVSVSVLITQPAAFAGRGAANWLIVKPLPRRTTAMKKR